MADPDHLALLRDVAAWNTWRRAARWDELSVVDLSGADLFGAELSGADLSWVDLSGANLARAHLDRARLTPTKLNGTILREADLREADLSRANCVAADFSDAYLMKANLGSANLSRATLTRATAEGADLAAADLTGADATRSGLRRANLSYANLTEATLTGAYMTESNLTETNLTSADLTGADLSGAVFVGTELGGATFASARVYGVSVWDVTGVPADQTDLIITDRSEAAITVDDLKVAQFVHLLLNNAEIRNVIDTVARKAVLILGRFTPERKAILDALRVTLRQHNYAPILFDFDKPASRDLTETVRTLAHMSRFIIADLTDPKSIPQELQAIVPDLAVPVAPIISGDEPYSMFKDLQRKYHWVLDIHRYDDQKDLTDSLVDRVLRPAEAKAQELAE